MEAVGEANINFYINCSVSIGLIVNENRRILCRVERIFSPPHWKKFSVRLGKFSTGMVTVLFIVKSNVVAPEKAFSPDSTSFNCSSYL